MTMRHLDLLQYALSFGLLVLAWHVGGNAGVAVGTLTFCKMIAWKDAGDTARSLASGVALLRLQHIDILEQSERAYGGTLPNNHLTSAQRLRDVELLAERYG